MTENKKAAAELSIVMHFMNTARFCYWSWDCVSELWGWTLQQKLNSKEKRKFWFWFKGKKRKFLYLRSLYIQSMNANESKDLIRIATDTICDMEALNIFFEFSIAKERAEETKKLPWL